MTVAQTYAALNRCELDRRKPTADEHAGMAREMERLTKLIERYRKAVKAC